MAKGMLKYLMIAMTLLVISVASCSSVDRTFTTIKNEIGSEISTTKEKVASLNIGIVQGIYCDLNLNNHGHYIYVLIEPTNAEADQTYIVSLYERGEFRQMNTISWNQPEINIKKAKLVPFNASDEEFSAYYPEYHLPYFDLPEGIAKQYEALYPTKSLSSIFSATIIPEVISPPTKQTSPSKLGLSINPQQVGINQPVTIKTSITTTGDATTIVSLEINGKVEQTKMIKDCPQGCIVEFIVTKSESGIYTVAIGGRTGNFTVK